MVSVRRVTLGREPHTYCLCFPFSLQDNPEVEKRDPQELVGEYPGVEGARGRSLSLTQSQVASLCFHRGSSSAMNLSLDSDSQGLWHFLRRLGETPREQFFWSHLRQEDPLAQNPSPALKDETRRDLASVVRNKS